MATMSAVGPDGRTYYRAADGSWSGWNPAWNTLFAGKKPEFHQQIALENGIDLSARRAYLSDSDMQAHLTRVNEVAGGGTGALTPAQIAMISTNQLGAAERDAFELEGLEREYSGVPDQLRTLYADRARAAGTWGNTNEFARGLESDVQAGARGAQAVLGSRINAIRSRLGREPLPGTATGPASVTDNSANNAGDAAAAAGDKVAPSTGDTAPTQEYGTAQNLSQDTTNNAVTSLQSRTSALKKKSNSY